MPHPELPAAGGQIVVDHRKSPGGSCTTKIWYSDGDKWRTDLIAVGMAHKAKWSDLAISVALILALAAACVSTRTAQRAAQTFDTAAFLVYVNEVGLGMETEDMPAAQHTE